MKAVDKTKLAGKAISNLPTILIIVLLVLLAAGIKTGDYIGSQIKEKQDQITSIQKEYQRLLSKSDSLQLEISNNEKIHDSLRLVIADLIIKNQKIKKTYEKKLATYRTLSISDKSRFIAEYIQNYRNRERVLLFGTD